jgi:hypothetical protein
MTLDESDSFEHILNIAMSEVQALNLNKNQSRA